jgi:signal transduction histidine kinase
LDVQSLRSIEFVKNISKAAALRQPLLDTLKEILGNVVEVTKADRAAIFSMNPLTFETEMPASIGISTIIFNKMKFMLTKSPVIDVIYRGEHIFENNVDDFPGKFLYLRKVVNFNSCIGILVTGAAGGLGYGLFLFHKNIGHFINDDLIRAEATANIIGRAIREHWVIKQVADDQRLTLLGGTIASIGHELRGRVIAFEAVKSMSNFWKELKNNPEKLSDPKFVKKAEDNLNRLEAGRKGMINMTKVFLGTIEKKQEQVIDIKNCLQSAINFVAHKASTANIEIISTLDWVPLAKGNYIELEQVFMNILLNAIEQITTLQRKGGRIKIETDYYPGAQFPIRIRFMDTGPGVHFKKMKEIFEPMYTTKSRGTGMGLYICRELLALMGGRIRIEKTAILVGTTFLIELLKAK